MNNSRSTLDIGRQLKIKCKTISKSNVCMHLKLFCYSISI